MRRINQPATKGRPAGDETKAENETSRSMSTSALELKRIFSQSDAGSRKNLLGASAWKRYHRNVKDFPKQREDFNSSDLISRNEHETKHFHGVIYSLKQRDGGLEVDGGYAAHELSDCVPSGVAVQPREERGAASLEPDWTKKGWVFSR